MGIGYRRGQYSRRPYGDFGRWQTLEEYAKNMGVDALTTGVENPGSSTLFCLL